MNNVSKPDGRICAIFTTYFPEGEFIDHLMVIQPQVDGVIIVDNTFNQNLAVLQQLFKCKNLFLIQNQQNVGVAQALNQGIRKAAELGFDWVLTLDQDSISDPNLVETYAKFLASYPAPKSVGIITANYKDKYTGMLGFPRLIANQQGWAEVPTMITAGSFFSIETFNAAGGFREEFFMDWADYDFCLKVRRTGRHNFVYLTPLLIHSIGRQTTHYLLFIKLHANNHSPFRCYLIGRNLTVLIRENFFKEFLWTIFYIAILLYKPVSVILWESEKKAKLGLFFEGIKDAILGNMSKHLAFVSPPLVEKN